MQVGSKKDKVVYRSSVPTKHRLPHQYAALMVKNEDKTLIFLVTLTYYRSMTPIMKSIRDILRNKGHPTSGPSVGRKSIKDAYSNMVGSKNIVC